MAIVKPELKIHHMYKPRTFHGDNAQLSPLDIEKEAIAKE
jgi:hypothetical protein